MARGVATVMRIERLVGCRGTVARWGRGRQVLLIPLDFVDFLYDVSRCISQKVISGCVCTTNALHCIQKQNPRPMLRGKRPWPLTLPMF